MTPEQIRKIADEVHAELGFPYTGFLERYTQRILDNPPAAQGAGKLIAAIVRDCCETEPDDDTDTIHIDRTELLDILARHLSATQPIPAQPEVPTTFDYEGVSITTIDAMCAVLKRHMIESTESTDCAVLYEVTFDQLRALYDEGRRGAWPEKPAQTAEVEPVAWQYQVNLPERETVKWFTTDALAKVGDKHHLGLTVTAVRPLYTSPQPAAASVPDAEVLTLLRELRSAIYMRPSCQVGVVDRCGCMACVSDRIDITLAAAPTQAEPKA